jgi:serine/threonine protein kinase
MALSIGDKLGPYEILGPVGKGGMGEVYRAHDSRLNRDVAIKVSNAQFTERFTREARAIAALNHTNICHLYDVGPDHLVMEYVEGQDLRGPLDLEEALPIIDQLIDGIEAAHEKNIIHRDLKPANIKITPEGVVKILDFGLAKAMEPPPSSDSKPENSPTMTIGSTVAGTILGTAAYMAPEQAKGKAADKRSDIWSFGVILYEMLTGKRLFEGDSAVEILGGILNKEPDISAAPPRIQKLLHWCLEKDRKLRLASISDARRLLSEFDESGSATHAAPPRSRFAWVAWGVAALAIAAAGALAFVHFRETPPQPSNVRFQVQPPDKGEFGSPALSPDGRLLAFTSNGQLWIRSFDSLESHALPGTEGAYAPFWSPDGEKVGFFADGNLKKVAAAGGPAQILAPAPQGVGGTWNRKDVILFGPSVPSSLFRVPATGGMPVQVTKADGGDFHLFPTFLPDGEHYLYFVVGAKERSGIVLGSLSGAAPVRLVPDGASMTLSEGHLLFVRGETLMAQPFDTTGLRMTGDAFPVVEHVSGSLGYGAFSTSQTGTLAYVGGGRAGTVQLAWTDRNGKPLELFGPPGAYLHFRLAPDEKHITYDANAGTGTTDIWVLDSVRGVPSRATFDPEDDNLPIWSPDGQNIVWPSHRGGSFDLYIKAANATGQEKLLVKMGTATGWATDWSRDGRYILYQRPGEKTGQDLWIAPAPNAKDDGKGESQARVYLNAQFDEQDGRFSPDGKWVAYRSNESGVSEIYVQSFPLSNTKVPISTGGGSEPQWSQDGTELFYLRADRTLMAVPITHTPAEPVRAGLPTPLFRVPPVLDEGIAARSYAVGKDGKRFLIANGDSARNAVPLTVALNWRAGVKK